MKLPTIKVPFAEPKRRSAAGATVKPSRERQSICQNIGGGVEKLGKPINWVASKLGCEGLMPQSLDLEMEKAARILRSFCIEAIDASNSIRTDDSINHIQTHTLQRTLRNRPATHTTRRRRVLDHVQDKYGHGRQRKSIRQIPVSVIGNCKGLVIFTAMRSGYQYSGGGGGSGILIRHLPDGSWSAPCGIHVGNLTGGFVWGLDIYDCVAVINSDKGMEGFSRFRVNIGIEAAASIRPFGIGQISDLEVGKRYNPMWTYTKNPRAIRWTSWQWNAVPRAYERESKILSKERHSVCRDSEWAKQDTRVERQVQIIVRDFGSN